MQGIETYNATIITYLIGKSIFFKEKTYYLQ